MGRKKKNESQKAVDVAYKGNVTITVKKGNKSLHRGRGHNEGTNLLFAFIANCMKRIYEQNSSPWFIRAFNGDDEVTTGAFPVQSTSEDCELNGEVGAYVELTFTIPGTSLDLTGDKSITSVRLYSFDTRGQEDKDNFLAKAELEQSIPMVDPGTNAVVVWRMEFRNASQNA